MSFLKIRRGTWRRLRIPLAVGAVYIITQLYNTFVGMTTDSVAGTRESRAGPTREFPSPKVDRTPSRSEEDLLRDIDEIMVNLPIHYLESSRRSLASMFYHNSTCARHPSIFDLRIESKNWQSLRTRNGSLVFYGAYYDDRAASDDGRSLRIVSMIDRYNWRTPIYCQIWFRGKHEPLLVRTDNYKYIWNLWGGHFDGYFQPYLATCRLPDEINEIPTAVSLVENACDFAHNLLKVIHIVPEIKKPIAVCVKNINFVYLDFSARIVEWIESLLALGVDKVFFYVLYNHPNVSKVLDHYAERGRAAVIRMELPAGKPNSPLLQRRYFARMEMDADMRMSEVATFNDCLYRNLHSYEYLSMLDTDEIIIPTNDSTWGEFLRKIEARVNAEGKIASYNARHTYFFDFLKYEGDLLKGVPSYMHMLRHVVRSRKFTPIGYYVKSIHRTGDVLTLHNHMPVHALAGKATTHHVEPSELQMGHYRRDCTWDYQRECEAFRNDTVLDPTMLRFKDLLIPRIHRTLKILGFI